MKLIDLNILIAILLAGCVPTKETAFPISVENNNESNELVFYQAFDHNWKDDPSINPIFKTKAGAEKYCKDNNMGNYHSYEVREVDYRYEVRVGFSDYTYSNGTWENILYTAFDFNDAYEYVVEYSSAHSDLIIYDLKTGKSFEETP